MPPRLSLKTFLATARTALTGPAAQRPKPLTFVVGNESAGTRRPQSAPLPLSPSPCPITRNPLPPLEPTTYIVPRYISNPPVTDLDSLCSALLYAYFCTHTPPHTLHIPLANLPREDLALRTELRAVLGPAGVRPEDLITLSDLPPPPPPSRDGGGLDPRDTRWLLVDHNALTGDLAARFAAGGARVVGCVDHHEDEGAVPADARPRVFARCGSCMSLVLDECRATWDRLSAGEEGREGEEQDAELARVALAPILVDTTNLTSPDKTTDLDVRAAELAESKLRRAQEARVAAADNDNNNNNNNNNVRLYDRTAYFEELRRLKEEIAGLSYRDVLRKDYKGWRGEGGLALGVSAVVQGFGYLERAVGERDRGRLLGAVRDWAAEQRLDLAAVMTASRDGGVFARELLLWAFGADAVKAAKRFAQRYGETLGLETWGAGELDGEDAARGEWRACWRQRRTEHSRKQVAPMLREVMREASRL